MSKNDAIARAKNFLDNEKQYRLGFIPIENPNPKTANMDKVFEKSTVDGVRLLQSVDRDLTEIVEKVFEDNRFRQLINRFYNSLAYNKRIVFSGCGSTGRLSILLEAAYRNFFKYLQKKFPNIFEKISDLSDSVISIMTGGDYALIRAVEFFEDYMEIGRKQVKELKIGKGDTLVAITATGETTSVLGTVMEAAERQADVFLLICVEKEIPMSRLERSKQAFLHPKVTVLDMPCNGMALTGSTRMQSTTLEQLIAGSALEIALQSVLEERIKNTVQDEILPSFPLDYPRRFSEMIEILAKEENVKQIATYIEFEESIYKENGLLTYYANEFLLDILTDTTERAPTFSLPHFRKCDDFNSPQSWSFVKNPFIPTPEAWKHCLSRNMRCLNWEWNDYVQMGLVDCISTELPKIGDTELMKFRIGNEPSPERLITKENAAVWIGREKAGLEFKKTAQLYNHQESMIIGSTDTPEGYFISYNAPKSPLCLMEHLAIKIVLNIISTGTMVRLGRVSGNWMNWLSISNKKLIDRSIRIISDQCNLSYNDACVELFISVDELNSQNNSNSISPVYYTIRKLKHKKECK